MTKSNAYVFTGGPGAGKTTVIKTLEQMGYATVEESGRQIIQEQVRTGGNALPWGDTAQYRDKMFRTAMDDFHALQEEQVFLDRGLPDVIGYTQLIQLPVDPSLQELCMQYRYNTRVFIFPPWEAIFCEDEERKQTFATAVHTFEVMQAVYNACDYELITVPMIPAAERAAFIISRL
ncbi:AAA family ATPase [Chitinophaga sp. MM2321]|uniref:AAA family ATPase n=1 Tax=Chitinophaga sp. MM2321 TaxID=3137178 RepID=UPI0032D56840